MSTTHGQPGLSSDQRSTIRSAILSTRHTLEDELRRQLEKYGIREDKRLPLEDLSHLSAEERHTRRTLDAAIERELESTEGDLERSITNYVREATKTYLNRFVALKTIEVRGLVEETITERPEYGNRSYMHHTVAEIAGELTNAPDDGFGAALDLAYQEIGAEIRMIFEESEHTAIDLDAQIREEVLDELDEIDDEAWESDEALGWVYQYFGEEEREEIDDRVDEENYKIAGTDIATKTQLFTPRYIVEWMVDNSLGRTWLEMQGERTNIDDEENCFYLAPLEDSLIDRETKAVEDITVLDPACGSGHMLFYAFDVLYQMYLEEGEIPEEYIPREILRNNLYGIDIDSGAAQIAALSLYLKAKTRSPDVTIPQMNIVSADAVLINGDRKQEILDRARSELEVEILDQIWQSFDNIRELGSLIHVEERIDEILEEHRQELETSGQAKFTQEGALQTQSSFISEEGHDETWDQVKERLLEEVSGLALDALEQNDPIEEMFAGEVSKTVKLLDLLIQDYDVVVSNPPYLGSAKMGKQLKKYLKENYIGNRDLYTSFIERNANFVGSNGYVAMITMETFMYLYSFRKLRSFLLDELQFVDTAHLENRDEGYMNTCFLMRGSSNDGEQKSRFTRLVNSDSKKEALKEEVRNYRNGASSRNTFTVDQSSFEQISRTPYIYWVGDEILSLFTEYASLSDQYYVKKGMDCGENDRFVRYWWEIDVRSPGEEWKWYPIGGSDSDYLDIINTFINWESGGDEVRNFKSSTIRNEEFFLESGLVVRQFGEYPVARYLPEDSIFNTRAHYLTSKSDQEHVSDEFAIGYINSSLSRFVMNAINPSVNTNVGDLKQLPLSIENETACKQVADLVEQSIEIRREEFSHNETNPSAVFTEFEGSNNGGLETMVSEVLYQADKTEADIEVLRGLIDQIIFDMYEISEGTRETVYEALQPNFAQLPQIQNAGITTASFRGQTPVEEFEESEFKTLVSNISGSSDNDISSIAQKYGVSPLTVSSIRYEKGLYESEEKKEVTERILSYYLGCLFGVWESSLEVEQVDDGILVFGEQFEDSIIDRLQDCFKAVFENPYEAKNTAESLLGKSIEEWFRNKFFRYHHCKQYRRRGQRIPIYWQLESPEGAFSCFVYYHDIDENTLPKLRGQYLDPRINELENELETIKAQTSGDNPDKELLNRKEKVQDDLDDIREFRDTIDEMIDDGIAVNIEMGIWENIKKWDQYQVLETGLPKLKSSYSR
ncbi:BREX-1 system adenine-specific DNA-methyltransferase PglX [Halobacterium salinarum]|uniref:BREX-1 system adenine-specific DNA-methyltransferase PglX n=1 Tax=Halobacterium salinarum TaxID=2242 RepID=UPI002556B925|nr:BREX-1 system adenine-specific DNA-methyltransferase PglX [Halobacterium salinarum]